MEVFLLFLSLGYGADFGRRGLFYSIRLIKERWKSISESLRNGAFMTVDDGTLVFSTRQTLPQPWSLWGVEGHYLLGLRPRAWIFRPPDRTPNPPSSISHQHLATFVGINIAAWKDERTLLTFFPQTHIDTFRLCSIWPFPLVQSNSESKGRIQSTQTIQSIQRIQSMWRILFCYLEKTRRYQIRFVRK